MSKFADVSKDVKTIVGEPLEYPSSPNGESSSLLEHLDHSSRNGHAMDGASRSAVPLRT